MKKIACLFIAFTSCTKNNDNPCDDVNKGYIMRLYKAKGVYKKEENSVILDKWIKELRENKCDPKVYYQYYNEVVNQN